MRFILGMRHLCSMPVHYPFTTAAFRTATWIELRIQKKNRLFCASQVLQSVLLRYKMPER